MRLDDTQIYSATCGAAYLEKKDGILFHRFTKEQERMYLEARPELTQIRSTAGIVLSFCTDSDFLELNVSVEEATLRKFFSFDVFANGKPVGFLDNFGSEADYLEGDYRLGHFQKSFQLDSGEKHIEIYFPWSVKAVLHALSLADGATFAPSKPGKSLLVFGDSITIGENVKRPSNRYCAKLAKAIGAQEFNKAIGGEHYCPFLSKTKESFLPDTILTAYGTNDWSHGSREEFVTKCGGFFRNLSENYPASQIYALTPIWRKDYLEQKPFGHFFGVRQEVISITKRFQNITVLDCFDLVPQDEIYYSDRRLHPNDEGNQCMSDGILQFI
ncbi:MAG: SGNH/GDSL hydrolase family protein [Oscillospiraceae bacterium]|nr:SGNH/GDSL hydrolase family protein [Oscillospiraceae bacterium]